jgi:acyl-CoA dehydrogenase
LLDAALSAGVITQADAQLVREAEIARNDAIQVDAFSLEDYQTGTQPIPATMTLV